MKNTCSTKKIVKWRYKGRRRLKLRNRRRSRRRKEIAVMVINDEQFLREQNKLYK